MGNRKTWSKLECHEASLKCNTRAEFSKKYKKQYDFAWRNKFLDDICNHMKCGKIPKVTFKDCFDSALKYKSRSDFKKNHPGLYQKACKNNWINKICLHMNTLLNNWTFEDCKKIASKYNTKVEFKHNHEQIYQKARKMGWLKDICNHMESAKYGCKKSDFIKACERNNNGNGILYLIKCFNNNEFFYKIGITSQSINKRYKTKLKMPYKFEVILEINSISSFIWDIERSFKKDFKQYKYIPNIKFKGSSTECFVIHNL